MQWGGSMPCPGGPLALQCVVRYQSCAHPELVAPRVQVSGTAQAGGLRVTPEAAWAWFWCSFWHSLRWGSQGSPWLRDLAQPRMGVLVSGTGWAENLRVAPDTA